MHTKGGLDNNYQSRSEWVDGTLPTSPVVDGNTVCCYQYDTYTDIILVTVPRFFCYLIDEVLQENVREEHAPQNATIAFSMI